MDKKDEGELRFRVKSLEEDLDEIKKERAEWQKFCVRLVVKTGVSLLGILTLGTFWGYLSPGAKDIIKELLK